ncbi:MAG: hypothetical protein JST75_07760 [Bacteroidetes bacterium]|nr:hypothetical protein [Bacteroidota bacterium]
MEQSISFGKKYHYSILSDAWLLQIGSLLSMIFALALVHLAGRANSFAGKLVLSASTVIIVLSLAEGTFINAVVQAADNGHYPGSVTSFQ